MCIRHPFIQAPIHSGNPFIDFGFDATAVQDAGLGAGTRGD